MKVELPPKYYLDHFYEMLRTLRSVHWHLLDDEHKNLIYRFEALSEDAQCLFIRMANRKGRLFEKASFQFDCWAELQASHLVRVPHEADEELFLGWAKKVHLQRLLQGAGVAFKKSWSRDLLLELYLKERAQIQHLHAELEPLIILEAHGLLQYILFVMFGKIQESLVLFTLRDLGVRKPVGQKNVQAKFQSIEEARSAYYYHTLREFPVTWPEAVGQEAQELQREWKLHFADRFRQTGEFELALKLYQESALVAANEKRARLLYELERKDECKAFLQTLIEAPASAEELFFAEDFLARKFEKKRVGRLTEILRSARVVEVDDSFFRHPELGVVEHYVSQGHEAHFAENFLWSSLVAIVFHDQLKTLQVHSEFDWMPQTMKGRLQYDGLASIDWAKLWEQDFSDSPMMKIGEEALKIVQAFVKAAPPAALDRMLSYLAEDYYARSTGFPDLLIVEDGVPKFIEVKAEGDSLKNTQLRQMHQLEKSGFPVEVLNVVYRYNPDQLYVVVDIETTGLLSSYNRITEVAAVKMKGSQVVDRFQTLLNPRRPIPRDIQNLTGITNEMVARAPHFEDIAESLAEFTQGAIFVAHNVNFDYGFIQREFARLDQRFVRPYICTKANMKKHYPGLPSYGLKNLSNEFGIALNQHHRAMSDAEAAAGLLQLINHKREQGLRE